MTVEHPPPPAEGGPPKQTPDSAAEALRTLTSFTRAQVAWLMSAALRWGYELRDDEDRGFWAGYQARVAEENASWPDSTILFRHRDAVRAVNQRDYRNHCDRVARLPRLGDHPGGPVSAWGDDAQVAA